jgi:hypothetical protein
MAREYNLEINEISATLTSIEKVLDLPKLEAEAVELEAAAGVPNLWDDPEKAQVVTSKLSRVQGMMWSTLAKSGLNSSYLSKWVFLPQMAHNPFAFSNTFLLVIVLSYSG